MKTIVAQSNGSPANNATRYFPFGCGGVTATVQAGSSSVPTPISVAGTITAARGWLPTALTVGSYTVTLMRSTGGGAFADTSLVGVTSLGSNDILFTGSATVLAGDLFVWKVVPASTPDTQTNILLSAMLEATTSGKSFILAGGANSTGTKYMQPGAFSSATRTATEAACPMPAAGVIDRLDVKLTAAPGVGNSKIVTVHKNGSSAGLAVTISGTDTAGSATGGAVSFAQGDQLTLVETVTGTPTASLTYASTDWTPTTSGEAVWLGAQYQAQSNTSTTYGFANGSVSGGNGTATTYPEVVPAACTVKKLTVITDVTPGVGKSRTISLLKSGSPQALSQAADTTAASDNTNSISFADADFVSMQNVPSGTPTANGSTRWGVVVVVESASSAVTGGLLTMGAG